MVAVPDTIASGMRTSTRYVFSRPGHPILLTTSAFLPFTVTATGELTCTTPSVGNGWPGSTPGTVGPRPVACTIKISPALAGLAEVTGVKSEWNTAGLPEAVAI